MARPSRNPVRIEAWVTRAVADALAAEGMREGEPISVMVRRAVVRDLKRRGALATTDEEEG